MTSKGQIKIDEFSLVYCCRFIIVQVFNTLKQIRALRQYSLPVNPENTPYSNFSVSYIDMKIQ